MGRGAIWAPRDLVSGATSERASDFWGRELALMILFGFPEIPEFPDFAKFRRFLIMGCESVGSIGESGLRGVE